MTDDEHPTIPFRSLDDPAPEGDTVVMTNQRPTALDPVVYDDNGSPADGAPTSTVGMPSFAEVMRSMGLAGLGWIVALIGAVVLIIGAVKLRDEGQVFRQIPYLMSAGVGGAVLVGFGSFLVVLTPLLKLLNLGRDTVQRLERLEQALVEATDEVLSTIEQARTERPAPLPRSQ
ncbi:MAG: hypothetical protein AB1679_24650 [Actinomycetota bacterium]